MAPSLISWRAHRFCLFRATRHVCMERCAHMLAAVACPAPHASLATAYATVFGERRLTVPFNPPPMAAMQLAGGCVLDTVYALRLPRGKWVVVDPVDVVDECKFAKLTRSSKWLCEFLTGEVSSARPLRFNGFFDECVKAPSLLRRALRAMVR